MDTRKFRFIVWNLSVKKKNGNEDIPTETEVSLETCNILALKKKKM